MVDTHTKDYAGARSKGLDEPVASWVGNKSSAEWGKVKQKEVHNFVSFI